MHKGRGVPGHLEGHDLFLMIGKGVLLLFLGLLLLIEGQILSWLLHTCLEILGTSPTFIQHASFVEVCGTSHKSGLPLNDLSLQPLALLVFLM